MASFQEPLSPHPMSNYSIQIEPLNELPRCLLGESPRWSKKTKDLIFIDILKKKVFTYNYERKTTETMIFDQYVGFAIPTSKSTKSNLSLYVGLEDRIVEVDFNLKIIIAVVARVPSSVYQKGMRFNDAECSPDGELYAGFMHSKWREGHKGQYFRLLLNNSTTAAANVAPTNVLESMLPQEESIHLPNGSAWNDDEIGFVIDSKHNEIFQLEFDSATAAHRLSRKCVGKRSIYQLSEELRKAGGMLDGMSIDSDGMLWVAVTGVGLILRIDPPTGTELGQIQLPCKKPTAVCFAGPDLNELIVTTRNENADDLEPTAILYRVIVKDIHGMRSCVPVNVDLRIDMKQQSPGGQEPNFCSTEWVDAICTIS